MTISYSYVAPSAWETVRAENVSLKKQVQELTAKKYFTKEFNQYSV
jgi:hypothetical protein